MHIRGVPEPPRMGCGAVMYQGECPGSSLSRSSLSRCPPVLGCGFPLVGSLVKATRCDRDEKPPQVVHNTYLYKHMGYLHLGSAGTEKSFKREPSPLPRNRHSRGSKQCRHHQLRELQHCCCSFAGKKTTNQPNTATPKAEKHRGVVLLWLTSGVIQPGCLGCEPWLGAAVEAGFAGCSRSWGFPSTPMGSHML